jgi:hypothetical protein
MKFQNLSADKIISYHLHLLERYSKHRTVFSSLTAALRDARQNTGRNIETGKDSPGNNKGGNWSGAICYLIIADQIGKCYKPKNKINDSNDNAIIRCLKYYTKLNKKEIDAIYALRNAFAHDYNISNYETKHIHLRHHFTLLNTRLNGILKLPKNQWLGFPDQKTTDNMTVLSLPSLGDLIENIYLHIVELHKKNNLEIILKGGAKELQTRYLHFIHDE